MSKQYLIDEETLKELLIAQHKLHMIEEANISVMDLDVRYDEYVADQMSSLSFCQGMSYDQLLDIVWEEDYGITSLVDDQIFDFWEPHHCEHGVITFEEYLESNGLPKIGTAVVTPAGDTLYIDNYYFEPNNEMRIILTMPEFETPIYWFVSQLRQCTWGR